MGAGAEKPRKRRCGEDAGSTLIFGHVKFEVSLLHPGEVYHLELHLHLRRRGEVKIKYL